MSWRKHIEEWSIKNNRDPDIQEDILIAKGWDPKKYQDGMKPSLFDYLTKWHTLHIKTMPEPATKGLRRNPVLAEPIVDESYKEIIVINDWKLWVFEINRRFTIIASNGIRYLEFDDLSPEDALEIKEALLVELGYN